MSNDHGPALHTGTDEKKKTTRESVAIIGFIVIAILGMAIAVYAARFVPSAISGLAGAGAYVSNLFILEDGTNDPVIVDEPVVDEPVTPEPVTPEPDPVPPTPAPTKPVAPAYYGLSDLTVNITTVGYCTTGAQNSLVPSNTVPRGARYGGVRFTVTNIGTNFSGTWAYEVETAASPSESIERFGSTIAPGGIAIGTVCFPRGTRENDGEVTVTVDSRNSVLETNERNNEDSERLDIDSWEN